MGRRRGNRLSILDMSMEDDSLLPGMACSVVKEEDEFQETQAAQSTPPQPPPVSKPPIRRSKKAANLRKSLAWDKAFLTGEGVLEPDELLIPIRSSPKRLPVLPTLEINSATKSGTRTQDSNTLGISNRSSADIEAAASVSVPELPILENKSATQPHSESISGILIRHADIEAASVQQLPRHAPKTVIESAIQKGTRLRLPSTITAEQKTAVPKESSLTKGVSLMSRKVKDTIGRVLPGRSETTSNSKTRACSNLDSVGSHTRGDSSLRREPLLSRSSSAGSRLKQNPLLEDSRPRPTGLRVPSPKLGFFDTGRPSQPVRPNASSGSAGNKNAAKSVQPMGRLKPHGLPKSRSVHSTVSTSQVQKVPSASAPCTPRKADSELLSPSARLSATNSRTPKGTKGSVKSSRKLAMDPVSKSSDSDQENFRGGGEYDTSNSENRAVRKGEEHQDGAEKCLLPKTESLLKGARDGGGGVLEAEAQSRSPLAEKHGIVNAGCTKERNSFLAFAKKAVGRLSSPVQEKKQEVKEESLELRSKEVKTGPVQHSPPNKAAPEPGPWSPVKKNGIQIGPFHCTKSNAPTSLLDWETGV